MVRRVLLWILLILECACLLRTTEGNKIRTTDDVSRRRRLIAAEEISIRNDNWRAYKGACGPLDFELYLSIGTHLSFYVQPADEGTAQRGCRPLLLHADASRSEGKSKDVLEVEDGDLSPTFFEAEALSLGTFRFQDIANAFDAIDVDAPGETEYHIVSNNCAVFILGMVQALGIDVTPDIRSKVVSGLVAADKEAGNKLANYIRESGEIERSLGLSVDATDEQLLERLTLRQIALALDAEPSTGGHSTHLLEAARTASNQRLSGDEGDRDLVVGGIAVTTQEYPFLVYSEEVPDVSLCGGVLVAPDVFLTTAGQCYASFQWSRRVLVGSIILGDTYGGAEWRNIVSDIIVHPQFKKINQFASVPEYVYDFAMMKIEPVTLANLTPAVLNSDGTLPVKNQNLVAMGYGRISDSSGPYESSPGLRKTTLFGKTNCTEFTTYNPSISFCAQDDFNDVCEGDYGAPLVDRNLTVLGLLSSGKACQTGSPNLYARISGGLSWIQETICKLSDYRGNYSFCPSVVCPVDLTLLGERNSSVVGGAALPTVYGSMMTPPQDSVTQSPAPGTQIKPGKTRKVLVSAIDSANQTTNCTLYVRVPEIKAHSVVNFKARKKNSTAVKSYSLDVPFVANYLFADVYVDDFKMTRTKNSVITLTFKRENSLNQTDSKALQTVRVRGNKTYIFFNVTAPVVSPDNSSYLYVAYFDAKNIKKGSGDVEYQLFGQVKKM